MTTYAAPDSVPASPGPASSFGGLLRQLRYQAELTQEELAEAARLSPRSVSDLERGINRTARRDTAVLLAGALGLAEPVRSLFVAAALGRVPAAEALAAMQRETREAFPGMAGDMHGFVAALTSFAGRAGAAREIAGLLDQYRLVTMTGPGGVGKTRLAGEVTGGWQTGSQTGCGWRSCGGARPGAASGGGSSRAGRTGPARGPGSRCPGAGAGTAQAATATTTRRSC